jgi:hypothetical protein
VDSADRVASGVEVVVAQSKSGGIAGKGDAVPGARGEVVEGRLELGFDGMSVVVEQPYLGDPPGSVVAPGFKKQRHPARAFGRALDQDTIGVVAKAPGADARRTAQGVVSDGTLFEELSVFTPHLVDSKATGTGAAARSGLVGAVAKLDAQGTSQGISFEASREGTAGSSCSRFSFAIEVALFEDIACWTT